MKKLKWVPTPPMAVALVALFVALSGAGYAAVVLPKNSVGSVQIRDGPVKRADLAGNVVNSGKVADRSLLALDFALGQLPAGPPGSVGPTGPAGPKAIRVLPHSPVRAVRAASR